MKTGGHPSLNNPGTFNITVATEAMYCGYNTIHVIVVFSSVLDKHYHVGFLLTILSDIQ